MSNQTDMDYLVQLIKDLRNNSQDDTDPNNVVIQKFQSLTDTFAVSELLLFTKQYNPMQWAGKDSNGNVIHANFSWGHVSNSRYFYKPEMGALICVLML